MAGKFRNNQIAQGPGQSCHPQPGYHPPTSQQQKGEGAGASTESCKGHIPRYISCLPAAEMVQATPFLLVLFLALGAPDLFAQQCILTGTWKNDLGSNMTVSQVNGHGDFTGIYYTAVSTVPPQIVPSPLLGSQHLPNEVNQPTFGFTVHWNFTESITVFTGQCFVDKDGKEVLKTMWLLRDHAPDLGNNWNATLTGYNNFWRL